MPLQGKTGEFCGEHIESQYEWRVSDFFMLSSKEGDWYESPDIKICGRTFNISLNPNSSDGYIVLYLGLRVPSLPIKILYTLGIKTPGGDTEVLASGSREFSTPYGCVYCKLIKRSELAHGRQLPTYSSTLTIMASLKIGDSRSDVAIRNAAVQTSVIDAGRQVPNKTGTTEIVVKTSVEDARDQEASGGRQAMENTDFVTLIQSLKDLYVAGKHCDVTLEVKDKKFRAHKLILGARTPVLAAMFSHDTEEAETGIVRVEDCDPEAFEVFLKFVYSDAAEDLTEKNVTSVYYVADKYNLPGLKKECVRHMLSNLSASSVCNVIALAERHAEELLEENATEFFVDNAREIFRTSIWKKFLAENNSLAYQLINRVHEN